jgi:hypothetical protein
LQSLSRVPPNVWMSPVRQARPAADRNHPLWHPERDAVRVPPGSTASGAPTHALQPKRGTVDPSHPVQFRTDFVNQRGRRTATCLKSFTVLCISVFVLAGCGSSSSKSNSSSAANKTSFCADNKKLDKASAPASNVSELLKDLKANASTIADFARTAPSAIKASAEVLVSASEDAIKTGNTKGFNQKFAKAGTAVDKYCGEKS